MGAKDQWRSRICLVFLLLVGSHLMLSSAIGTSWWALGVSGCSQRSGTDCPSCTQLNQDNLLNEAQQGICQNDDATVKAVSRGARKAIIDCQAQFRNLKWNCSTFYGENLFGSFVNQGTRETAVLYAYMSAGATQGVAEACHDQIIQRCPCEVEGLSREEDADGNIIFNDCNDNIEWALRFVQGFVDNSTTLPSPSEATARDLMDIHNNALGRRIVRNRTTTCVCHGISGTCTVQTCYKKVPDVGEIGSQLHTKYDGAVKVRKDATTNQLVPKRSNQDLNITEDLVFSADSPDFCSPNLQSGILGTRDRICDRDSSGPDSCTVLCCGRGHYRSVYTIPVTRCQFVWCCRIECGVVGNQTITEYRCN